MKPILLVVAGIAMLVLTTYFFDRGPENKRLRPTSEKSKMRTGVLKNSDSFLPNEAVIAHFFF